MIIPTIAPELIRPQHKEGYLMSCRQERIWPLLMVMEEPESDLHDFRHVALVEDTNPEATDSLSEQAVHHGWHVTTLTHQQ